ncbi:ABC transporter permease [Desulfatiglans anilini]|uniref:ABC transporter permease n=1 Tax=Desulfatiglans anilini TaxID=90728 RepID=UPI000425E7BB|nr:ABC transporter permease [Desulfatiglans anilini]
MEFLSDSIASACRLIWDLDPELLAIVVLSLEVSCLSTALAGIAGVPAGILIALNDFPGKRLCITICNTLLALPTVVVGLFAYAFISRKGVLGAYDLLYTPAAIVIGQTILLFPVITTFVLSAVARLDDRYRKTALTLGAGPVRLAGTIIRESRFGIMAAFILAFGRVIAEVGISMMLGGNVKGYTRTITTAMALEYDKGEFTLSVALGMVLLAVSFSVNILFHAIQGRSRV